MGCAYRDGKPKAETTFKSGASRDVIYAELWTGVKTWTRKASLQPMVVTDLLVALHMLLKCEESGGVQVVIASGE
jgi:hypothetical protein